MEIKDAVKEKYKHLIGTIKMGYKNFLDTQQKVQWSTQVWSRWIYHKHKYIFWMAMLNRFATRERLMRFMNMADVNCVMCMENHIENRKLIFFDCKFSAECLRRVKAWLGWQCVATELEQLVKWVQRSKWSKFKKQVVVVGLAATVYMVWQEHNKRI